MSQVVNESCHLYFATVNSLNTNAMFQILKLKPFFLYLCTRVLYELLRLHYFEIEEKMIHII